MLPTSARLRRSDDFRAAVGRGRRAGRGAVVLHLLTTSAADQPAQVGFVVSKAVGTAVVRNTVTRRLRHLMAGHLAELPRGSQLVVRARPGAASAGFAALSRDLSGALSRLLPAT